MDGINFLSLKIGRERYSQNEDRASAMLYGSLCLCLSPAREERDLLASLELRRPVSQ